jgi:hypothetical protein
VIQHPAHTLYQLESRFNAQAWFSQLNCEAEKLLTLIASQRFPGRACLRRWANIQPLLDPLHGGAIVFGHGAVVDAGVDHRRVEPFVAQELLDSGHPAGGVQQLRRVRMTQFVGIDLDIGQDS